MGNKFYEAGAGRAARVKDLFSAVAPRYDLVNDLQSLGLHRLWKRRLLGLADPKPGELALDLCCGTGDIALSLAGRGASVVGLDFSPAMLAVAAARAEGRRGLEWICGDAENVPYPADRFDIVTVGYGLRNLSDWRKGLAEMWRVARPGGRLLVLDFGKPPRLVWRRIYFGYLKRVVPLFGRWFCGDAETYSYILESLTHYPAQEGVAAELGRLGCEASRVLNLLGGVMSINVARKACPMHRTGAG